MWRKSTSAKDRDQDLMGAEGTPYEMARSF